MNRKKSTAILILLCLAAAVICTAQITVYCYNVPQDSSRVRYFYVFGPDGDPKSGAEDNMLTVYFDLPENEPGDLMIAVYDPTTGGKKDWRKTSANPWDTKTEFSLFGKDLLAKEEFGEEGYDRRYYQFGPFAGEKGKKTGNVYRFRLEVKGISGDDANLFSIKVSPDSVQAFVYDMTFRLLPYQGDKMTFYPEIKAGIKKIFVKNYDLDRYGGASTVYDPEQKTRFTINDSQSGEWSETVIPLEMRESRRLRYEIIKGTQRSAHAGLKINDERGDPVPIYFRKGKPEVAVKAPVREEKGRPNCNTFTFDATESYDPDNQELAFAWDFGDGTGSDEAVATHIYEQGGDYQVTLTVTDNSGLECDTAVITQMVRVNTPPAAEFYIPEKTCVGMPVDIDASATTDNTLETLSYVWDLGDGSTAEGVRLSKVYDQGGKYRIRLTVDDQEKSACSVDSVEKTITVNTSPEADAGENMDMCLAAGENYRVKFDASASVDADRDDLDFRWDFGDGTTGSGRKTEHIYAQGGEYTVRLIVDDRSGTSCSMSMDTVMVKLNKAPVAVAGEDVISCAGTPVSFDAGASLGEAGESLAYTWDFGDGSTEQGAKVRHIYAKGGNYRATLTVDDKKGTVCSAAEDTVMVIANTGPEAELAAVKMICTNQEITFDASGSSDPDGDDLTYTWDFGDGTGMEKGAKAVHRYKQGGIYPVSVTVNDRKATACSLDTARITVMVNTPPVADAGPNLVCCVGAENVFDGSFSQDADGDSLSYAWDFGDGEKAEGRSVKHVYRKPGDYKVTLTVDDGSGSGCGMSMDSFTAKVNAKPRPVIKVR